MDTFCPTVEKCHSTKVTHLDHGVVGGQRIEFVIEHSLADDVQRQATEKVFHLNRLTTRACLLQLVDPVQRAVAKHVHHARHILFVQGWHNHAAASLPHVAVCHMREVTPRFYTPTNHMYGAAAHVVAYQQG